MCGWILFVAVGISLSARDGNYLCVKWKLNLIRYTIVICKPNLKFSPKTTEQKKQQPIRIQQIEYKHFSEILIVMRVRVIFYGVDCKEEYREMNGSEWVKMELLINIEISTTFASVAIVSRFE